MPNFSSPDHATSFMGLIGTMNHHAPFLNVISKMIDKKLVIIDEQIKEKKKMIQDEETHALLYAWSILRLLHPALQIDTLAARYLGTIFPAKSEQDLYQDLLNIANSRGYTTPTPDLIGIALGAKHAVSHYGIVNPMMKAYKEDMEVKKYLDHFVSLMRTIDVAEAKKLKQVIEETNKDIEKQVSTLCSYMDNTTKPF